MNKTMMVLLALVLTTAFAGTAGAEPYVKGNAPKIEMKQITTQAQAEALKPGDSMSMACGKCKAMTVQKVTEDMSHCKMMTVGEKFACHPGCDGTVEVVATGKGAGKDAEVKLVCSKCGEGMFCCATEPGSGSMKDMKGMKDMKDMKEKDAEKEKK